MELQRELSGLEKRFYEICTEVVAQNNLELYDMDYLAGTKTLRVFVMQPNSFTAQIDDCIAVDRGMSPFLEEEWVPDEILLEVSTPGLERRLRTLKQFESTVGEEIDITIRGELPKESNLDVEQKVRKKKRYAGVLKECNSEKLELDFEGSTLHIPFEVIKKANKIFRMDI